ncbi:MAG: hypothetical protein JNK84_10325 [Phreatobacter sp.]|uniref:hypothetical protein n=1 Tax=Phreatobacter sp. TaxID=1966341 RepID=UPI001A5F081D|nr:hypothetical protein [Phreatobacter sp.]MBL8569470.1 hypothetical protein [Phreatobacter sp.]
MKHIASAAFALALFPPLAQADPYPTTLSQEEQERHEFLDVQQGRPSGLERSFGGHFGVPRADRQSVRRLEERQGPAPDSTASIRRPAR